MSTETRGESQLQRTLMFLAIGLVLGGAVTYGALTPTLSQVPDLSNKINQLQRQVNQLTQVMEYKIGASMPLTGNLSDVGTQWQTVLQMASDDLNAEMAKDGIKAKFTLVIKDDKSSVTGALQIVQTLGQSGVKVIVGPAASDQIKACLSYVIDNKIVLISPSSSSAALAIPNDYIFRTVGSDAIQAKALAALVNSERINRVIVFHRDDEYGVAFANFFEREFTALGGSSRAIPYASNHTDYASDVAQLSTTAQHAGVSGIVMISLDTDGMNILSHAKDDAFLSSLNWFSSDGLLGATGLLAQNIAQFMQKTNFMGTRLIFRENQLHTDFAARYKAKVGSDPPIFSANLYDAVFLAGWAIVRAIPLTSSGEVIKSALPDVAKKYYGASGWCIFDANGDKMYQDYSIWTIQTQNGTYAYADLGSYSEGMISFSQPRQP